MSLPSTVADDWANTVAPANPANANGGQKKPRHRHAPEQLVALNELFEKDEHPPLEVRATLAERLGMETKTVNAWFQNKRASSKKRTRNVLGDRAAGSRLNAGSGSSSASTTDTIVDPLNRDPPQQMVHEEEYHPSITHIQHPAPSKIAISDIVQAVNLSTPVTQPDYLLSARSSPDSSMPKKMRMRPSNDQTEELKKVYNTNPHPTAEERQALADRIGMRYQSITNWFQNQRSLAKRRKGDEPIESFPSSGNSRTDYPHNSDTRQYSAFPPPPPHHMHPSLTAFSSTALSLPDSHVSSRSSRTRRSPSLPPLSSEESPRRSSRRSMTPYSSALSSRPRRSRPEPFQLDALKDLFTRTSTPTIEERSALALEIGMDVGKVTNWFRNLRQTARKRSNRFNDHDFEGMNSWLDDDDVDQYELGPYSSTNSGSRSVSRHGTPSLSTRSSSPTLLDADVRMRNPRSSIPSDDDEDYSEAITPEPGHSPSPTPGTRRFEGRELPPPHPARDGSYPPSSSGQSYHSQSPYRSVRRHYSQQPIGFPNPYMDKNADVAFRHFKAGVTIFDPSPYNPVSKTYYTGEDPIICAATAKRFGINIEDAYLLLDFHRQ